jgi:flagellin
MAQVINTNSLSLLTQNNLNTSQSQLNTAIQRLSSGLRINSAKDDAAGQAIANRFTSSIRGLNQAQRNANDGISLAQTTEGALTEVNNNLQRVRELTVQAANGSNSQSNLDSIQGEITQRLAEIDRLSSQTDFNGMKVLSANQSLSIQVGANDTETISIGLKKIDTNSLNINSFNVNRIGTSNTGATKDDLTLSPGWTQGTAGAVGYKTGSSWVAGAVDATTGAQTFTQTVSTITTAAAAAYDVNYAAATRADVFNAASTTGDTVQLNGSVKAKDNYTYNSVTNRFVSTTTPATVGNTTNVSGEGPAGGVAAYLVPTGSGQVDATVRIGGTDQKIKVDSTGNVTDEAGTQLYLDITGNLTQNTANGGTALTKANIGKGDAGDVLKSMNDKVPGAGTQWTGGTITVNMAGGSTVKLDAGAGAATANGGDKWTVTENLTKADMQAKAAAGTAQVVTGGITYDVAVGGGVKTGGADVYMSDAGATPASSLTTSVKRTVAAVLEASSTTTVDYHVQTNGAVMDGAGNRVYKDSDATNVKGFTLTARSGSTSTANPLSVIDAALAQVDSLRAALGSVQNRFDSTISNLGTTITNLSSSRSRIEDADYATEVSNMTRAQILQQAGTSVLAQANQTTQGVLSLLR